MTDTITITMSRDVALDVENALAFTRAGFHCLSANALPGMDCFERIEAKSDRLCGVIQQIKLQVGEI